MLVDPARAGDRKDVLARLERAPATLVVDIEAASAAKRADASTFHAGRAKARQVRFAADGKPVCQSRIEVKNSEALTVTFYHRYSIDYELIAASFADLSAQIAKAFTVK